MFPANQIRRLIVFFNLDRGGDRAGYAFLERHISGRAGADMDTVEYRAILKRDEARGPQQIRCLAHAVAQHRLIVIGLPEIGVMHLGLMRRDRKGIANIDDIEISKDLGTSYLKGT